VGTARSPDFATRNDADKGIRVKVPEQPTDDDVIRIHPDHLAAARVAWVG
jgi:hypothetical protein